MTVRRACLGLVAVSILVFLVLPVLIVFPLSFSSGSYLSFPPPGFSLRWYAAFFESSSWTDAALMSLQVAIPVTLLATALGTPAAIGLARGSFLGKRLVNALVLSPIIVPGIIVAIGTYFAYAQYGLVGHPLALILGHTCLAVPFVVINVTAALQGVDRQLERAALSLGASPSGTFRQITLPLIAPGIAAGAVFAFITSFDELLIALFLSGTGAVTLPRRMFDEIRYDIDPTIAAVSSLLIFITTTLMLAAELLRRRSDRRRTQAVPAEIAI
ncbi:MAG TPA: ABC transporter permease [Acetobacteraceae bacterium]|nr:ABC transporter permease [Acetobacteraceae bacterium]